MKKERVFSEDADFIFENSRAAIVLTDEQGRWRKLNRAAEIDFGYSRDELLGKKTEEQKVTTEQTLSDLKKLWNNVIKKKKEVTEFVDVHWTKKDGTTLIHSAWEVPYGEKGEGRLYTGVDVTEIKIREKELLRATEETTRVVEYIGSGDYEKRISTGYEQHDVKLLAETLNMVMDYLKRSDDELKDLIKELATPAIEIMDGIVVMPLVGKLTSDRALDSMESMLDKLEKIKGKVGIIDITGVPNIDSAVADSLMKTMESVKLVGATAVLTGISAKTAANLVRIGIRFDFITKATLSEGLEHALNAIRK